MMKTIGRIASIMRYPVKSMAGEALDTVFLGYAGLFGDRLYAFVEEDGRKGFPWFTIRQYEDLVLYKARVRRPGELQGPIDVATSLGIGIGVNPLYPEERGFDVEVQIPTGEIFAIREPGLKDHLEEEAETKLALRYSERSLSDSRPVSIFSNSTIAALQAELDIPLDPRRFRANIYVDWIDERAFSEKELVGSSLQLGERARLMVTDQDPRCKIITIDPDTAEETPKILRHISSAHGGLAGIYGAVLREGMIRVGDRVEIVQ